MKGKIEKILYTYDPVGLGKMGAPEDEYSPEAEPIAKGLPYCKNLQDVDNLVYDIFCEMFDPLDFKDRQPFTIIAIELWDKYQAKELNENT